MHYTVAISYRASADVLRSLLEAYPKSAKLPNGAGSYPVHLLCDYGSSIESLKMLLQTNEGTSTIALTDRTTGLTPLYVLNARKNGPQWRRTVARVREARNRQPTNSDERKCGLKEQKNDFWRKASFLTFVEYTREPLSAMHMEPGDKNDNDTYGSMLHACAGLSHCPTSLLEFAILIHTPEELQAKKDKDGRLALHVAAATHASALLSRNVDEQRLADGAKQDRSEEALLRILRACPQAAFVFDNNGELPFTLALRVQQQWREKFWRETTVATHAGSYWSKGGLQRLLATNPPALETLNLDERLYPYIWANRLDNAVDELYRSIRRHPNLVQSSRNSSPAAYCCPFRAGPVTIEA